MNFKKFRVSKNILNVQGSTSVKSTSITVNNDNTITDGNIASGAADRIYWTQEFDSGTYTFSANASGGITSLRVYSNKEFTGGTYNQYYNGWYCDVDGSLTFTTNDSFIFGIIIVGSGSGTISNIMLNTGSQPLPYEPYGNTWTDTPHYIHNTSTDTITTLPADIYANDTTVTVGLKGNMSQTGTPTSTTPIQPQECGDRTEQLFDKNATDTSKGYVAQNRYLRSNGNLQEPSGETVWHVSEYIDIGSYTNITISGLSGNASAPSVCFYDDSYEYISGNSFQNRTSFTVDVPNNAKYIRISIATTTIDNYMLNLGSTALPYEPYGIKIPVSSANTTTNVYLGEVETTRNIIKYELTGQENWVRESGNTYALEGVEQTAIGYRNALCTHYVLATSYNTLTSTDGTFSVSRRPALFIHDENFTTAAQLKTYLATQYANGTPVTIFYVLNTSTTGIVNEPIRKIGTYADEVSGITIPVTAGANTLSVDTTLQPSEITVNYKGWHPVADVHKRENGQWD